MVDTQIEIIVIVIITCYNRELLFIRDDHLVLSNNVCFTPEELESLINYIMHLLGPFQ